jgi:protein-tyrosine phosphatase
VKRRIGNAPTPHAQLHELPIKAPSPTPPSFPARRLLSRPSILAVFTLHTLRALRRKAKLKGDPVTMASTSAQVPESPSSSKRSRSRGSTPSGITSSRPFATPSASTSSLRIQSPAPDTPGSADNGPHHDLPYPAFLRLPAAQVHMRWNHLELAQLERLREGAHVRMRGGDQPYEYARCNTDEYAMRNRYANVDPYQENRVKLHVPDGHFDYINASPILLHSTKSGSALRYIATQGPKSDSWSHMWRMIWNENQDPAVVVMLTQTYEANREKCYPYYPSSPSSPDLRINEHDEFLDGFIHNLHLVSLSQDEAARTEVREIDMVTDDGSESRKIWHLLFAAWPDFSAPEGADRAALLQLIHMSRQKNGDNATNPRIVHCSAGIGRSGTFIALDWLIQELDEGSLDETPDSYDAVVAVINKLRDQRAGMVQSKIQFLFLYDALRELWQTRYKSLNQSPDSEPALKRQKSRQEPGGAQESQVSVAASDILARARLEAELMGADMEYEHGRTHPEASPPR